MSAKPKKGKPSVTAEKFLPPDMEAIELHEDILFNAALNNDYTTICGALDAKDHPLTAYMIENNLFNKRNKYGKNFADLSANLGNKEFIRLMLERLGDRVDENAFNLKAMLSLNNSYNFMHYACIWGQTELVKFLVDYAKMIADPTDPQYESISMTNTKDKNSNLKPIGSVLLKLRTRETKETPLMLAERYKHQELVEFLNYAEKRQAFIESTNEIKVFTNDPEKNFNKLNKDDKKKLEKLYIETVDWIEKLKQTSEVDMGTLESKISQVNSVFQPIVDACRTSVSRLA